MHHTVKILYTGFVTHNVKRFILEKPEGYKFTPGQATDVAINKNNWKDKKHPFTFTSLNSDLVLEFTIKGYPVDSSPDHEGMTEELHKLKSGDELILDDPWGTIKYKGKGVFLAGGAGITPFIAILRKLREDNSLKGNSIFFSNKTAKDIILEKELKNMASDAGLKLILTLTQEQNPAYEKGRIDKVMLKKYIDNYEQNFYVCGPKGFVKDVKKHLSELGASTEALVFEK